jgi:hypothetical protein
MPILAIFEWIGLSHFENLKIDAFCLHGTIEQRDVAVVMR